MIVPEPPPFYAVQHQVRGAERSSVASADARLRLRERADRQSLGKHQTWASPP